MTQHYMITFIDQVMSKSLPTKLTVQRARLNEDLFIGLYILQFYIRTTDSLEMCVRIPSSSTVISLFTSFVLEVIVNCFLYAQIGLGTGPFQLIYSKIFNICSTGRGSPRRRGVTVTLIARRRVIFIFYVMTFQGEGDDKNILLRPISCFYHY